MVAEPESDVAAIYNAIAEGVIAALATADNDGGVRQFPEISISDD